MGDEKLIENSIQKNDEILYSEWVPTARLVKIVLLFVFILIFSLGIIITAFIHKELIFIGILLIMFSLFFLFLYWNFRGIKITLTNNQLEVIYGIFNHKKIPIKNITSCDVSIARFRTYGGIGIRIGFDGSIAYNTDFGEAVKLTFHEGRAFLFSTKHSQEICNLINELLN